jgi:sugar phosphate permease
MRRYLGAIYSCGRTLGILVCYLIATISSYSVDYTEHIIVFFGPAYISIIQAVLVKLYLPDSVIELLDKNRNEDAR